jgi:hypothetical protein
MSNTCQVLLGSLLGGSLVKPCEKSFPNLDSALEELESDVVQTVSTVSISVIASVIIPVILFALIIFVVLAAYDIISWIVSICCFLLVLFIFAISLGILYMWIPPYLEQQRRKILADLLSATRGAMSSTVAGYTQATYFSD